jgi:hypothetical protein
MIGRRQLCSILGTVAVALLLFTSGCTGADKPRSGSAAAAVVRQGILKLYLGQPGIADDISIIEVGGKISYGYWRLTVPDLDPGTFNVTVDLSTVAEGVSYTEYFLSAPGCGPAAPPWRGSWSAGDPGVSGSISIDRNPAASYQVQFEFSFAGTFATPCGNVGTHTSRNDFVAPLIMP